MSYYRIYRYPYGELEYRHLLFYGRRPSGNDEADVQHHDHKLSQSLSRSRRMVRDYILCNGFTHFCTFTFAQDKVDRQDFRLCRAKLTKFFNNYRSRYSPDFRYLVVPERHQDGAWHFHGVVRGIRPKDLFVPVSILKRVGDELILVPNTPQYASWIQYERSLGFFNISRIRSIPACALYVTKYITKDLAALEVGSRVLLHSQDLCKPELVFDEDNIPRQFDPTFSSEFFEESWVDDHDTVGGLLPLWFGDNPRCTDDSDDFERSIFEPVQLVMEG